MEERRIAWVGELPDSSDTGRWSARFAAHWEEGSAHREGPDGVALEEALRWAREQAAVVYVSIGGDELLHSAGSFHPDDSLRRWPDEGIPVRPRPDGTPYDGSQQSRRWEVRVHAMAEGTTAQIADQLRSALESDARVATAETAVAGTGELAARLSFEAPGAGSAVRACHDLVSSALGRLGFPAAQVRCQQRSSWDR